MLKSLKYVQTYAQSNTPPPTYGSERSLFLTALLLAYKFVEDCGTVDSVHIVVCCCWGWRKEMPKAGLFSY